MSRNISPSVFIQSTSKFKPWHNDPLFCGGVLPGMTFLRIPSCFSGFIQDFLDHLVLINVCPIMYTSGAYNALFLSEFLSNRLQTLAQ